MIQIENLYKSFGHQEVLRGVDIDIPFGDRVILMGQNGAGKTTLIRCILGEYRPDKGCVSIGGANPVTDRVNALKHIAFVPQTPPPLKLSVKELIDYTSGISGFDRKNVESYCEALDLDIREHNTKQFGKLSGGMKQKLLISIAFSMNAKILIFDEPTANLDPKGRDMFRNLLGKIGEDKTFIFISHRIEEVSHLVSRAIELDLGKVVKDEKI